MTMKRRLANMPRDYYGGGLMVAVGIFAVAIGLTYSVGSLNRMGPGYFPVALGALLVLVGLGIAFAAWLERAPMVADEKKMRTADWRGWACICGSLIAFIVLAEYGGFIPATAAATFISALADRDNSVRDAALLAAGTVVAVVVIFWWALKMTFPLFGWGTL